MRYNEQTMAWYISLSSADAYEINLDSNHIQHSNLCQLIKIN